MKKLLLLASLLFLMAISAIAGDKGPSYNIKIKINGLKDTMVYLANYFGDNTYLVDSARMDNKGTVVFKRDTALECGIYMIAVNRVKLFEFIVFENEFSLETDVKNYELNMKVKGSKENDIFFEFQKYTAGVEIEDAALRDKLKAMEGNPQMADSVAKINERLKQLPMEVYNFRMSFSEKYPDAVITRIFMATKDPKVPPPPVDENGKIDSNWQFYFFRDHYWDNVDFASGCILRSPIYANKLKNYMERLTVQHPDSIYDAAVRIIEKARINREMFRYTVQYIMNKYEKNQYICMDAVPVKLALKYYTYEDCYWLDSTTIYRTRANAESYYPTLCNKMAPPLKMHDSTLERKVKYIVDTDTNENSRGIKLGILLNQSKTVNLYDVKANYTVLVFWDPDCGHCKKEMPVIQSYYDTIKKKGVEVYAVGVEQDLDKWINYIREHHHKWISVIDMYNLSEFRKDYNINSTPQIFLLDKDKKIIAKRLSAEQLKEVLYRELGLPYTKPAGADDEHDHEDEH